MSGHHLRDKQTSKPCATDAAAQSDSQDALKFLLDQIDPFVKTTNAVRASIEATTPAAHGNHDLQGAEMKPNPDWRYREGDESAYASGGSDQRTNPDESYFTNGVGTMTSATGTNPAETGRVERMSDLIERLKDNLDLACCNCTYGHRREPRDHVTSCVYRVTAEAIEALTRLREERDGARAKALEEAANWCGRQASALRKLNREPEKREAFVEAHNAIRSLIAVDHSKPQI